MVQVMNRLARRTSTLQSYRGQLVRGSVIFNTKASDGCHSPSTQRSRKEHGESLMENFYKPSLEVASIPYAFYLL